MRRTTGRLRRPTVLRGDEVAGEAEEDAEAGVGEVEQWYGRLTVTRARHQPMTTMTTYP